MRPPRWLWVPAALAVAFVVLPLAGVLAGLPWGRLGDVLTSPASRDALSLSLRTAVCSTALVVVLGVPLAVVLDSLRGPVATVVRTVVLAPLVLPPVVSGLALLAAFGRRGLLGATVGGGIAFTTVAVVLAQAFVSLPYLVLAVAGALRSQDRRLPGVATTLGATPGQALRRVVLPLVAPSLVTGTVLALARALGEFGATLTFAGSLQGVTRTLPLEIYLQRETDPDAALGLSLLLLAVATAVVGVVHGRGGAPRRAGRTATSHGPGVTAPPARVGAPHPVAVPGPVVPPVAVSVRAHVPVRGLDLALDAPAGQVVAVVGPNGAGKSTLLDVVAGLLDGGTVRIDDTDVTRVPAHRRGVGLVPQGALLMPHLTVLDDVALGPRWHGAPRTAARRRARAELTALDAGHLADRRTTTLSGGQAQRVAVARALAASPRVLLLDEPTAALDVDAAADIRTRLAAVLAARPTTTLLVTHDVDDVRALATRVVVVDGGRVVADGPTADVLADPGFAARLAAR